MRACLLAAVVTSLVSWGCSDLPGPTGPHLPVGEQLVVSPAAPIPLLLASTTHGELVEVDLDVGTLRLVGDVGVFEGRELGWSSLRFDDEGTLFMVSTQRFEDPTDGCFGVYATGACSHLFVVDPITAKVVREIGSTGMAYVSEIDFDPSGSVYGGVFIDERTRGDGGLISVDLTTASASLIGRLGPAPDPTMVRDLENGGLAFDPNSGDLWGVESSHLAYPPGERFLYRVNTATGEALNPVALERPSGFTRRWGSGGLEILSDGRFVATLSRDWTWVWAFAAFERDPDPLTGKIHTLRYEIPWDAAPEIQGWMSGLSTIPPLVQLDLLVDHVDDLQTGGVLGPGQVKALIGKISDARKLFSEGKPVPAVAKLEDFKAQVARLLERGVLAAAPGQSLIDSADDVIRELT